MPLVTWELGALAVLYLTEAVRSYTNCSYIHLNAMKNKQTNTQQNRRHEAQRREASCVGWGKSLHVEHKWAAQLSTRWEQTASTFLPENAASPDHTLLQRTLTVCPLASGPLHQSGCRHWTNRINYQTQPEQLSMLWWAPSQEWACLKGSAPFTLESTCTANPSFLITIKITFKRNS